MKGPKQDFLLDFRYAARKHKVELLRLYNANVNIIATRLSVGNWMYTLDDFVIYVHSDYAIPCYTMLYHAIKVGKGGFAIQDTSIESPGYHQASTTTDDAQYP